MIIWDIKWNIKWEIIQDLDANAIQISCYISDKSDKTIEFYFMIDKLNIDNIEYREIDNGLHLLNNFPLLNQPIHLPKTAQA